MSFYTASPAIASPFEAFREVHCRKLDTDLQRFCFNHGIINDSNSFNINFSSGTGPKSYGAKYREKGVQGQ